MFDYTPEDWFWRVEQTGKIYSSAARTFVEALPDGRVATPVPTTADIWDALRRVGCFEGLLANGDEAVSAHALALKIGAVNALRTDGGDPYPVSPESLAMIRQTYADTLNEIQADALLNGGATDAQKQTVGLIKAGFDFMRAVDAAAAAIIAAGDGADPIASDQRWPTLS